ncbi:hypothetical protein TIFTF001_052250, partial [Ficus carica]
MVVALRLARRRCSRWCDGFTREGWTTVATERWVTDGDGDRGSITATDLPLRVTPGLVGLPVRSCGRKWPSRPPDLKNFRNGDGDELKATKRRWEAPASSKEQAWTAADMAEKIMRWPRGVWEKEEVGRAGVGEA